MRILVAVSTAWLLASTRPGGSVDAEGRDPRPDDTGTLTGTITLKDPVPASKTFKTAGLGAPHEVYPDGVSYAPVDVDEGRRVRSALVYVKSGLQGKTYAPPKESARMDLEKYQLRPRVLAVMVGQPVVITNREAEWHAIHALPNVKGNKEFNRQLNRKGMTIEASFAAPEVAVRIKGSDLHDWEQAWIAVLPHPFYGVTDDRGVYAIKGLPPGTYTVEAWQENCTPITSEVEVKAMQTHACDMLLEAKPASR